MDNIVFVGLLYESNLGDQAICECCVGFVDKILKKSHKEFEFRFIDLYGRNTQVVSKTVMIANKIVNKIKRIALSSDANDQILDRVRKQCETVISDDTKAIIFTGGGLIKYEHQFLSEPVIAVINYVNTKNIPVMISATGIEGYDDSNNACTKLKNALNSSCIKMITTRDDIDLLNEKWVVHNCIETALVADPACSLSLKYATQQRCHKLIGLGIGRENLFMDYGCNISNQIIMNIWRELYLKLKNNGFDCVFFTNGLKEDEEFAKKIVGLIGEKEERIMLPKPISVRELANNISLLDGAIVTRLHSSIISYSYNIPFVGLVWNKKQKMFGQRIGHPECFLENDDINADIIYERFMHIYNDITFKRDDKYCASTSLYIERFLKEYAYDK